MTTPKARMQPGAAGAAAAPLPRLTRDESFHAQPVAIQNNVLYNKQRAALLAIPQLMDNPLYEGFPEEAPTTHPSNCYAATNSHLSDQPRQDRRTSLSRLSLDDTKIGNKHSRRLQSWSLSSRDYEGMWRTVQENVFKSTRDSMSALEDFKQFRQKLADLKQAKDEVTVSAPPPTPTILTPSGSIRSLNLGSVSTRSLNLSPSRPSSPLQRLSVISSRKGVSGLNPQRDTSHRGSGQLAPSVHRFALSMRAEGLFKLPNPASISPLTTDLYNSPPRSHQSSNSLLNSSSTTTTSKRRFFTGGCAADAKRSAKPPQANNKDGESLGSRSPRTPKTLRSAGAGQTRCSVAACVSNEVESFMNSCSPRSLAALNTMTPRTPRNAPQQQQQVPKKRDKISMASSCSPRAKDMKGRCIHIPRPMCYSAHILE